jgi:Flp pilus assembly protein TadD
MSGPQAPYPHSPRTPIAAARLAQALRRRAEGEHRRATVLMREACCLAPEDPCIWTHYGVQCWRTNRRDEARQALRQAIWLRQRRQEHRRAHVLRALLLAMESASAPQVVSAA